MTAEILRTPLSACHDVREFPSIDIAKFLCSLLVIAVHVAPFDGSRGDSFGALNDFFQHCLGRLAVPFFFISTGFLVFRSTDPKQFSPEKPMAYAGKTLRFYLIWTAIYGIFILESILKHEKGILYGSLSFLRLFLVNESFVQLWYLHAATVAVALAAFLLAKRISLPKLLAIAVGLYLIGLIPSAYFGLMAPLRELPLVWKALKLVQKLIVSTRNGLFFGFLFVAMGIGFAHCPIQMKLQNAVSGFLVSMLLLAGEILLLERLEWVRSYDMFLSLVPASFFLFYIVSHIRLPSGPVYKTLRTMSSLIYFTHLWVYNALLKVFALPGLDGLRSYGFVLTLGGTLLVSAGILALSRKPKFTFLAGLYS